MKVGISIVTYNSEKHISNCLESVFNQAYEDFEIVLTDNNSSDNTLKLIDKTKSIYLIENKENEGFTAASNKAIKELLRRGCSSILLLNPDTILEDDLLSKLVKGMSKNNCSIAQPSILLFDKISINTCGNSLHYLGFSFCQDYKKKYEVSNDNPIAVASGACMLIKKEVIDSIGTLDDSFEMYQEDTDFSIRARLSGFNIFVISDAVCYHDYLFKLSPKKQFLLERNRLLILFKNYSIKTLILISPIIIIFEFQMLVYSLLKGWFLWKLFSYFSFLLKIPSLLINRKQIQNSRKSSDKELFKHVSKTLLFKDISNPILERITNPILELFYFFIKKLI